MIQIETPRLVLREHTRGDLMALHEMLHDRAVTWTMQGMYRETVEDTDSYLRSVLQDQSATPRARYNLAIADRDDVCVGEVGLHLVDGPLDSGCWGLGYYLKSSLWNQGYATEAVRAACGFLFARGASRISASCLAENTASRMVLWKCGFTREGMLLAHTWHDGQWKGTAVYRLLRSEWLSDGNRRDG